VTYMASATKLPHVTFSAAPNTPFKDKDAKVLGPILYDLAREEGGFFPERLVEIAAPKASPAHRYFTWDDEVAAHSYRIEQAQKIARSIQIIWVEKTDAGEEVTKRAKALYLVVDIVKPGKKLAEGEVEDEDEKPDPNVARPKKIRKYVTLDQVTDNEDYVCQVISQAKNELKSFKRRYNEYAELRNFKEELGDVWTAVSKL